MRNKANGGHLLVGVGRQSGIHITILVHLDIGHANALEFVAQIFSQFKLLGRAWRGVSVLGTLGVEADVVQKSFYYIHSGLLFEVFFEFLDATAQAEGHYGVAGLDER